MRQEMRGREIERGYLGVGLAPINEDFAASLGLEKRRGEFVQTVQDDSPAAKAGLKLLKTEIFTLTINTLEGNKEVSLTVNIGTEEAPRLLALTLKPEGATLSNNQQTTLSLTADTVELKSGDTAQASLTPR